MTGVQTCALPICFPVTIRFLSVMYEYLGLEGGPYCGVIGWLEDASAVLSVGIRIFWSSSDNRINFGTGAGITWQSDPKSEWQETELKAKRLIAIAAGHKI